MIDENLRTPLSATWHSVLIELQQRRAVETFARQPADCKHERADLKCSDCGIDFRGISHTDSLRLVLDCLELKDGESFRVQVRSGYSEDFWHVLATAFEARRQRSPEEPKERVCACIPLAPRPWKYCQDCGGRIGAKEPSRCIHGAVVCEKCAAMAVRNAEKAAPVLAREHLHWCAIRIGKDCNCRAEKAMEPQTSEQVRTYAMAHDDPDLFNSVKASAPIPGGSVYRVCCARCQSQINLTASDGRVNLHQKDAVGWYFSTETGWLCPADAPK